MEKKKTYHWTKFTPESITKALDALRKHISTSEAPLVHSYLWKSKDLEKWEHDAEAETHGERSGAQRT
jgi:hypothetical protein